MDEEQERVLLAITDTIFDGMDRVFRNTYALYADKLDNSDDIYQAFVVLMSQVLGRHLAAFPEEQRAEVALIAEQARDEMLELVLTETAKAELAKAQTKVPEVKYDLAKMKPEGNA